MPAKKSENSKKVMDVNSPGEAAPSATSRPVIVTHKPMIEDPMVARPNPEVSTAPALAGKGKTITPLTTDDATKPASPKTKAPKKASASKKDTSVTDENSAVPSETPASSDTDVLADTTAPDTDKATVSSVAEPQEETAPKQKPAAPAVEAAKPESAVTEDTTTEETAQTEKTDTSTAAVEKKKAEAEAAAVAQQAKYEKMIADKTYFVPIDQSVSSSPAGKVLSVLLLLVLIAVIAGVLLVDAGIIETSIELPINLIQNK